MGRGIVQMLAQSEVVSFVLWKGRTIERVNQAKLSINEQWNKLIQKGVFKPEQIHIFSKKIRSLHDYEEVSSAQCIIEAVSEDILIKQEIFESLASSLKPETILASNTSSLSITELARLVPYPENVVGIHFFNPAPIMKLTEIILGLFTSQKTVEWTTSFVKQLQKESVLVKESPGFIVNRILIPMINEAICLLAEGIASEQEIDKAMCLGANHRIGPFALADLIGNDVVLSIMDTLHCETGDPKYRAHPLLRKIVRGNLLGRKTQKGFYQY
ncbi:MAG: 3-hydroxybutyryl-CoA dehydrogenase [Legionella sp.]|nr:MAG: 3-hydroxybutyryl-CoA dehydrogenase [Legionella sp.]